MKKLTALCMGLIIVISLAACGKSDTPKASETESSKAEETQVSEPESTESSETENETGQATGSMSDSEILDGFAVEAEQIDSAKHELENWLNDLDVI